MRFAGRYILLATLVVSCGPAKVVEFLNPEMDYSDYSSYRLINFKSDQKDYSQEGLALFNQIEQEIEINMEIKGFESSNKEPDLIVRYELMSTTTTESQVNSNYYYDPYYYYTPPSRAVNYTDGLLLIEFRDRNKKKLVWQASLDLRYSKKETPEMVLKKSIDRIFETYPYQAGSNQALPSE